MNGKQLTKIVLLVAPLLLLWGCEPSDPGSPLANQPPDTRIVVAPLDSTQHDHYVSPTDMFYVQWFGYDPDGLVAGYWIQVDSSAAVWTTEGGMPIAFESSQPDPNNPGKTLPQDHIIRVTAVDNEGASDPTPAQRLFYAVNSIPEITAFVADFADSATVGQAISFGVEWADANESGMRFQVTVNGQVVTSPDWVEQSEFQFCDLADPTISESIDTTVVHRIDIASLPAGTNTIVVRLKDLGEALSDPVTRTVTVVDTVRPQVTGVTALYGTAPYYVDGSIFYRTGGRSTTLTINATAAYYKGVIQGYRYRYFSRGIMDSEWTDSTDWSEWGGATNVFNLDKGVYLFELICRDYAGNESEVTAQDIWIVEPNFDQKTLLIVDETRDGNGNPGSPSDIQCDTTYRAIFVYDTLSWTTESGWQVTELDYVSHKVELTKYVSPRDVFDKRVIFWSADDQSSLELGDNLRILGEYLDRGGRLIISGWDVLAAFTTSDVATFSTGFVADYLRVASGEKNSAREFVGIYAESGTDYPDSVNYDPAKIPANWAGLPKCWALEGSRRTEIIATWKGAGGGTFSGRGAIVRNFHPADPWKTITLGFPLFFMKNEEAQDFIARALEDINQ